MRLIHNFLSDTKTAIILAGAAKYFFRGCDILILLYSFLKLAVSWFVSRSLSRVSVAVLINLVILYKKPRCKFHLANPLKKQIRLRVVIIACRQMQSLATTDWIIVGSQSELRHVQYYKFFVYLNYWFVVQDSQISRGEPWTPWFLKRKIGS